MKSRISLACCLLFLLPAQHSAHADFLQRVSSIRSLPTSLFKDSVSAVSLSRRRSSSSSHPPSTKKAELLSSIKTRLKTTFTTSTKKAELLSSIKAGLKTTFTTSGYYYGLPQEFVVSPQANTQKKPKKETLDMLMNDALSELKGMRQEMTALRKELKGMKRQLGHDDDDDDVAQPVPLLTRLRKQREWDSVGMEIEKWAEKLLFEEGSQTEEDGWKEIKCSRICKQFNKDGRIQCYVKWMKDSRGTHANQDDDLEYPCMKVFATLDAPMEQVCAYLADANSVPEYNDVVVKHEDVEEISPHSKICWGQSPKILFVQPRNFITFCHHRWLRDGTQVIVNQACNHEDFSHAMNERDSDLKAFALRGANFISPHPDDPNKTRFSLVAHANPGPDLSPWMCKLAVNNLIPIEPFKLFHKINKNVQSFVNDRTQMVSSFPPGRSNRPGGLSQMGYACFWPNGGGLKEGFIHPHHPDQVDPAHHPDQVDPAHHPDQADSAHHPDQVDPVPHSDQVDPTHHPDQVNPAVYAHEEEHHETAAPEVIRIDN